ncbi:hypothetical protein KI387_013559, partial [Taxus chinensis]
MGKDDDVDEGKDGLVCDDLMGSLDFVLVLEEDEEGCVVVVVLVDGDVVGLVSVLIVEVVGVLEE